MTKQLGFTTMPELTATQEGYADNIASRMMRGPYYGNLNVSAADREKFEEKYKSLIGEIIPHLPRGGSSIGAVVAKCAIKYGKEKAIEFAEAVKNANFNGEDDPAHLFWRATNSGHKRDAVELYCITVTAARAYCRGKTLAFDHGLRKSKSDIFDWDENWEPSKQRPSSIKNGK